MQQQASAFRRARERGGEYRPPVWAGAADLPIAISLAGRDPVALAGDLVHFAGDDSDQPIDLHLNPDDVPLVQDMVAALCPMLAGRIRPVTTPKDYAAVRSVFDHRHYLYQVQDSRITRALAHVHDPRWRMLRSEARYRRAVATASFASSLPLLRHHARQQIASRDLPRRVWLGDDPHHGQAELLEQLTARGFQAVAPHRMPLSQVIALMQGAEIVVAPAGVGLAQMLHMRRDALAIHLDRAQVLADGWGRHLPAAHAARCRYVTVLVDDDAAGAAPGIRIGKRATDRILRVVDLHLSRRQQTAMA